MASPACTIDAAADSPAGLLGCATPAAWIARAVDDIETLLLDHANCEKKAASTALALMFRYPQHDALCRRLSRLAREELRHYEQVARRMRARGIAHRRVAPTRYAAGLRQTVRSTEPGRLIDTLICGAFIEARSCERFAVLAPVLDHELGRFYSGLMASESRHFRDYLRLAGELSETPVDDRVRHIGRVEAGLIASPDPGFGFHSGVPSPDGSGGTRPGQSRGIESSR